MRLKLLLQLAAMAACLVALDASAQVYSGNKWGVTSRTYVTNVAFLSNEQAAMARGMSTWNAVGPGFRFVDGGFSGYSANSTTCGDTTSGIAPSYTPTGTTAAITRTCYTDYDQGF